MFWRIAITGSLQRKKILVEWIKPNIPILSENETSKHYAILLNSKKLTKDSINPNNNKLKIVSGFGVGYDSVDLDVLKNNNILLTNTPNAVRRPATVASLTMILASSSRLLTKDNLLRFPKTYLRKLYVITLSLA